MKFLARSFDGLEILRAKFRRVQDIGDVEADGELFVVAQFLEEIEIFEIAASAVDAGDAVPIGPFHGGA